MADILVESDVHGGISSEEEKQQMDKAITENWNILAPTPSSSALDRSTSTAASATQQLARMRFQKAERKPAEDMTPEELEVARKKYPEKKLSKHSPIARRMPSTNSGIRIVPHAAVPIRPTTFDGKTITFVQPGYPDQKYDDVKGERYSYRYFYVCTLPSCNGGSDIGTFQNTA